MGSYFVKLDVLRISPALPIPSRDPLDESPSQKQVFLILRSVSALKVARTTPEAPDADDSH